METHALAFVRHLQPVVLSDGSRVWLRPLRPQDRELIRIGFERLSPESRYQRFFVAKAALLPEELRYLSQVDQIDHLAIIAVLRAHGREEAVGLARAVRLSDEPETFEVAVTVVDPLQGRGLGRRLVWDLLAAAEEQGARRVRFTTLPWNRKMRALIRSLGGQTECKLDTDALTVTLTL